jgi:ribosomal protein S18 acetylase RimI-like enzyme
MAVTVRPLGDRDFFPWLDLFAGYCSFYDVELTDEKALRVWSWISDKSHELGGAAAHDDAGGLVGFVHFRQVPHTLTARRGLFVDDIYVKPEGRGGGVGHALLAFAQQYARDNGLSTIELVTKPDNEDAQKLYGDLGARTEWLTYEIEV